MRRHQTLSAVLLGLVACVLGAPADAIDSWKQLRRPLRISHIDTGARCPVTRAGRVSRNFGVAQGKGPVYPVGGYPALTFIYPPVPEQEWYGSQWSGNKILWIGRPTYRGPVLIRGRQLDGPNELRFQRGLNPAREMKLSSVGGSSPGGWQNRPSYTRVRAPGCYAWQVDGLTFSRVIVFRAELAGG